MGDDEEYKVKEEIEPGLDDFLNRIGLGGELNERGRELQKLVELKHIVDELQNETEVSLQLQMRIVADAMEKLDIGDDPISEIQILDVVADIIEDMDKKDAWRSNLHKHIAFLKCRELIDKITKCNCGRCETKRGGRHEK